MKGLNWLYLTLIGVALLLMADGGVGGSSPIPDVGTRVLITYNEPTRDQLPQAQKDILVSREIRDRLDAICVKNSAGDPEYRIVPATARFGTDQPIWQRMMAVPRAKPEWLVVADGRRGVSTELPPDETALLKVLAPFGGGK